MTDKEQDVHDEAINLAATAIKQALKDKIREYPEDFAPALALPDGIKKLAGACMAVLLNKAERDSQEADKGCALLMTAGATFLVLNVAAITAKVVELYNADKE